MATHADKPDVAHQQHSPLVPLTLIDQADTSAGICIDGVCVLPGATAEKDADD